MFFVKKRGGEGKNWEKICIFAGKRSYMVKEQNLQGIPEVEEKYPRYLSNHPQGEDLYEGKSQERLADALVMHITETDQVEEPIYARLIGLEGKWGSGKSNVIKILEDKIKEKYIFFCFDAWGNQEDLQRRSILESLTRQLIKDKVLKGKVKIQLRNGKTNEASWEEQLALLLSNKTTTIRKSTPKLTMAAFWGIGIVALFAMCSLVAGQLITTLTDFKCYWWLDFLPIVLAVFVAAVYRIKDGCFDNIFRMVDHTNNDTIDEEYTSSEEPSVPEFKIWMKAISDFLGICKNEHRKLVICFDNMDRLSSEKVHQFWSLIQTFFADDGYKNIWCIVPYDEEHLASVFSEADAEDCRVKLLRCFLDKTFPVVYRVPEPIVSDYKYIFEKLYREAFGTTVDEDDLELISQCYRQAYPSPNVREIIRFVNSNVQLAKQWGNCISPISRAIFVLKSDDILRNPKVTTNLQGGKIERKATTTDEYLLSNEYYRDFRQILMGNVQISAIRRNLAAMVYGVAPEKADQIVVKRYIRNCLSGEAKDSKLATYVANPHFMMLLFEDVQCMSIIDYVRAVAHINEIDESRLTEDGKKYLKKIWRYFATRYNALNSPVKEYSDYEKAIFSHVTPALAEKCAKNFCKRLIDNKEVNGAQLYQVLSDIFEEEYAKSFNPHNVCPASLIEAQRFADYVQEAGADYKRFPLSTKPTELNSTIEAKIDKDFPYLDVLSSLKGDGNYSVLDVGNYAVQQLNLKKASALVAVHYIEIQRLFFEKFQSNIDANYIATLWQEVQTEQGKAAFDEIYTLKSVGVYEQLPAEDRYISILMDKVLFYTSTNKLIAEYMANTGITFRGKLLKKMILEKKHDGNPDYSEFIEKWPTLVATLGVSKEEIIYFADSWGYKTQSDQEQSKSFFTLLNDVVWIDSLLTTGTPLAKEMLVKCVSEMSAQPISKYLQPGTATHANTPWNKALQKLASTDYVTADSFGLMTEIVAAILDWTARNNPVNDATWNALIGKVSYTSMSTQVSDIRNHILNGENGYTMTPTKFQYLHEWLEQAGINTESHCSDAANQILSKVVDDETCQNIILAKKDYYRPIIADTIKTASSLHGKLKTIVEKGKGTEFGNYIQECVKYE